MLVNLEPQRLSLFLWNRYGNDLFSESARGNRLGGAALTLDGELVLSFTSYLILRRDVLRRYTHMAAGERAGEAFAQHRVFQLSIAHPIAPARIRQNVWSAAHRSRPPGFDQLRVPRRHRPCRTRYSSQTRA